MRGIYLVGGGCWERGFLCEGCFGNFRHDEGLSVTVGWAFGVALCESNLGKKYCNDNENTK